MKLLKIQVTKKNIGKLAETVKRNEIWFIFIDIIYLLKL